MLSANRHKFDPRSKRCVFLGFGSGVKGYVLLDISTSQVFWSQNVVFYDHILPYTVSSDALDNVIEPLGQTLDQPLAQTLDQPLDQSDHNPATPQLQEPQLPPDTTADIGA